MSFDWQTDEDDWQTEVATAVTDSSASKRKWLWGTAVFAGLLVITIIGWWFFFRQAQQRWETAVAGFETEVAAAHTLMQDAAFAGDLELFEITLLPSNEWRETQVDLLAHQLFWNRSSLGLWLDLARFDPEDETQTTYEFAPDLRSVVVTSVLPYVTMGENDELHEVSLLRTAVFRNVNNQWQLAPFPDEFWGDRETIEPSENGHLTTKVYTRDLEIGRRLTNDLNILIDRACDLPDFDCPNNLQVELDFKTDPKSSNLLNQNYRIQTTYRSNVGRVMQIDMPTPTLVGLPVDKNSYQALYRGYAAQLLARIISNLDSNCCSFGPTIPSLFAVHLQTLGFNPPRPSEFHPQQKLVQPPIPFPDQDIIALCQEGSISNLYRYDPMAAAWYLEYGNANGFVSQMVSAGGDGVLISTSPSINSTTWQLAWVVDGEMLEILHDDIGLYVGNAFPFWEENSQDLAITYAQSGNDNWISRLIRTDLSSCTRASGCVYEELDTLPMFSPERTRSMVSVFGNEVALGVTEYWLGDAAGEPVVQLGQMSVPAWLDEETLLFAAGGLEDPNRSLVKAIVADGQGFVERESLLTGEEINDFMELNGISGQFVIAGVVVQEQGVSGDVVPIYVIDTEGEMSFGSGYMLELNLTNGRLDWMEPFEQMLLVPSLNFSPDGRFLQVTSIKNGMGNLHLLDMKTREVQTYPVTNTWRGTDWSADGEWLAVVNNEELLLIAPSANFERKVFYTMTDCHTAVWVNR